jgi:glycosyltransferase involved in cell wall biosynthesis
MTADLSILIPSRNEMFLKNTIEDILKNIEGNTEVIAVLDGAWADPPIPDNERVTLIYNNQSIGQRASTNKAAKLSKAKYLMKCDAHCAFDKGFDIKMMREMQNDWTMAPLMKNLHAFDWVCPEGHRRYQGPSGPCLECGKPTTRDILWQAKKSPNSVSYCFDSTPHFQYFGEYAKRPEGQGEITETMSLQGSCWMLTREKYWELNVCDEAFGSWGSQGIEVAVKTWLSGGRVMVNKKTWYAHMFRTQGGDFGFPYPISGSDQEKAKKTARDLFFNNKWDKQIHPLSWLVEKFWPVKGWTDEDLKRLKENTFKFKEENLLSSGIIYQAEKPSKGIIFYTDNQLKIKIADAVRKNLAKSSELKGIPIISSSLKKMTFGDKNIHFPSLKRGYLTMFKQILGALENSTSDIIFFCEHDVLYHPSHFDFTPPEPDTFYYNQNVWFLRASDGHAMHFDVNQLSGLCVYREAAITHFKERIEYIEKNGFPRSKMGFEPFTHHRIPWQNQFKLGTWKSEYPNIDIKHGENATGERWEKAEYRNQQLLINWQETDSEIPGWGETRELIKNLS